MTDLTQNVSLAQTLSLIDSYDFDLGNYDPRELIQNWVEVYPTSWISLATIEALYQGRYKLISIEQILSVWLRMGNPNPHFSYEFERLICRKLPKHLTASEESENSIELTPILSSSAIDNPSSTVAQAENINKKISNDSDKETTELGIEAEKKESYKQMSFISSMGIPYQPDWSDLEAENTPIHQFIPLPDVSLFFNKLKAFAGEKLTKEKLES